jgi:hypothetical protein
MISEQALADAASTTAAAAAAAPAPVAKQADELAAATILQSAVTATTDVSVSVDTAADSTVAAIAASTAGASAVFGAAATTQAIAADTASATTADTNTAMIAQAVSDTVPVTGDSSSSSNSCNSSYKETEVMLYSWFSGSEISALAKELYGTSQGQHATPDEV